MQQKQVVGLALVVLLVVVSSAGDAQTSRIPWSTFSMGYGAPKSATSMVASVVGQNVVGTLQSATSRITSGFLVNRDSIFNTTTVYAGDANNDGVVDARDILPIGRFFNTRGYVRENGSLTWSPQLVRIWTPLEASYADCNGDGVVHANDVDGIIQNYDSTRGSANGPSVDRVTVCKQLLREIDQQPASPAMKEIRAAVVSYMTKTLGVSFAFALGQNYPNPFNPSTTIRFTMPEEVPHTRIVIYNMLGQQVWEKGIDDLQAGEYEIVWSGETSSGGTVASGMYFYKVVAGSHTAVKRMLLIK
jgi:hypothetical protein